MRAASPTPVGLALAALGCGLTFLSNLKHNKVLHRLVIFLTILSEEVPRIAPEERIEVTAIGDRFYRVTARYGFMQDPRTCRRSSPDATRKDCPSISRTPPCSSIARCRT
ncbi:MAG TPA: KUP/HAK/KT family potassium transporter [Candidatus Methylomirabilis sp.]|nr:KUP/HAK/KT family potassium transporter [Candidatus Methylomirabilis sp.]